MLMQSAYWGVSSNVVLVLCSLGLVIFAFYYTHFFGFLSASTNFASFELTSGR